MENDIAYCKTPIGTAKIVGNIDGIISVTVLDDTRIATQKIPEPLQSCVLQLQEYFQNKRTVFDLKLNLKGTEFQKRVWQSLLEIPFAKTTSYLNQSKKLGNIKAIRAVASANGKNPIWIIIPCHRVLGSDGSLTGYAGGIWRKKWLLEHENPTNQTALF